MSGNKVKGEDWRWRRVSFEKKGWVEGKLCKNKEGKWGSESRKHGESFERKAKHVGFIRVIIWYTHTSYRVSRLFWRSN